jgi:hypothetical protein
MRIANVLILVATSIWGLILIAGFSVYSGAKSLHLPDLPNSGQITYYIVIPAAFLITILTCAILANRFRRGAKGLALLAIVSSVYAMPHMLFFTGGI